MLTSSSDAALTGARLKEINSTDAASAILEKQRELDGDGKIFIKIPLVTYRNIHHYLVTATVALQEAQQTPGHGRGRGNILINHDIFLSV